MPPYAGPTTAARPGDVTGTLRLMAYLALALVLIVLDHRGGWLNQARRQATALVQPLWAVAGMPGRIAQRVAEDAGTLAQLTEENRQLRRQALLDRARMARMRTIAVDNARLRRLLDAAERGSLDAQLAPILDVDLDPTRQRLVLDAGSRSGVRRGQSVIDAGGLLGQVIDVTALHSTVLLLTDPDHAVPVAVARNGVRLVAYGRGRSDLLALQNVPLSSDIKVGDVLVTSGLGGRFPPGFAVGTVTALRPDYSRAFLVGDVKPAAQLDRGRDVLLLRSAPPRPVIGPEPVLPATAGGATEAAGQGADASSRATAPTAKTPPAATPATAGSRIAYPPPAPVPATNPQGATGSAACVPGTPGCGASPTGIVPAPAAAGGPASTGAVSARRTPGARPAPAGRVTPAVPSGPAANPRPRPEATR